MGETGVNKAVSFEVVDGCLVIGVDPNRDGQAVVSLKVDLAEVPDEVAALFKK